MAEQLLSVGIDVGTSTTQLVFSRLLLEDMASAFSVPRVAIADKEVIYRSDVYFTPLLSERVIDHLALRTLIEKEYDRAGVRPEAVDTGAVIITGETARKENAAEVLNALSGLAGDFVVATAGADLEGIIAAKGAGLDQFTKEHGVTKKEKSELPLLILAAVPVILLFLRKEKSLIQDVWILVGVCSKLIMPADALLILCLKFVG